MIPAKIIVVNKKGENRPELKERVPDISDEILQHIHTKWNGEYFDYEVKDDLKRFIITQRQIEANGVETAVCKYFSLEPVTYYVDDGEITPLEVEPENGWAILEISAETAGRIDVFIEDERTTIFAI